MVSAPPKEAVSCVDAARRLIATAADLYPAKAADLREVIAWLNALMGLDGEGR